MRFQNYVKSLDTKIEPAAVARMMRALLEAADLEEDEADGVGITVKRAPGPAVTPKFNWLRYG